MKTKVQSLASLSGLRIWCCHEPWCRLQRQLRSGLAVAVVSADLTPRLRTSICHRCGPKKAKEKKRKKKRKEGGREMGQREGEELDFVAPAP